MSQYKEQLRAVVAQNPVPTISTLISSDDKSLSLTKHIVSRLVFAPLATSENQDTMSFYIEGMQEPFLIIDRASGSGTGPLVRSLEALLLAARIHEVDSFSWVNLPYEQREELINKAAARAGISSDELRQLIARWAN